VAAVSCVEDGKSAVRWIREHASEFLIDPNRIVAAGGSAGGHLAACTALIESFDASDENSQISSRPNALVLFNPALVLAPAEDDPLLSKIGKLASMQSFAERMGVEPQRLSPYHHVEKSRAVPTIIFHGKVDQTVPFATVEAFHSRCQHVDSPCELVGYDDQPHGFFNFTRKDRTAFKDTLLRTDQFLVSLNYLTGTANVKLIDQLAQAKTEK
jgi:acetyl esterase/lipase